MIPSFDRSAKTVVAFLCLIVLFAFAMAVLTTCEGRRKAEIRAAEAKGASVVAQGTSEAAKAALGASEKAHASNLQSEALTGANRDAILSTQGADRPIGGVHATGLVSLCKRASYADDPRCRAMRSPRS